jgi:hypothetical protein
MKAASFVTILLLASSRAQAAPFESLSEDYAAKARIVEALDKIVLTDVNIQKQRLPDAISLLKKKVPAGSGNLPEIDTFIESSGDPFLDEAEEAEAVGLKGVTLEAASISFARAIDLLCRDSDYRWLIKIDEKGKPILKIEPKEMEMLEEIDEQDSFPNGEPPVDLKDPGERDMLVSYWYQNMRTVVESLQRHTGHKFKPVAKVDAGPVEILEEQAAFMKAFLEETERIARKTNAVDEGTER